MRMQLQKETSVGLLLFRQITSLSDPMVTAVESLNGSSHVLYLVLFPTAINGKNRNIPTIDMANPPMVPAASGNQNASLEVPTIKGINPSMVETTVRKMGMILEFHALM